jgi:hypothetical protein
MYAQMARAVERLPNRQESEMKMRKQRSTTALKTIFGLGLSVGLVAAPAFAQDESGGEAAPAEAAPAAETNVVPAPGASAAPAATEEAPAAEDKKADPIVSFQPAAQYRVRGELAGARDLSGDLGDNFIIHRARIGLGAKAGSVVSARLEIQDVRKWGFEMPLAGMPPDPTLFGFGAGGIDMHQGYLSTHFGGEDDAGGAFELRIGRQEISLDSQRLIGAVDWTMQGRSFDGARLLWDKGMTHGTVFATLVRDADATVDPDNNPIPDAFLFGFHLLLKPLKLFNAAPLILWDTNSVTEMSRVTAGARLNGADQGFSYDLEGYYQGANTANGLTTAFMAAARAGYTLDASMNPHFGAFVDYLSGDGNLDSTEGLSAFDTLYATNHKFYGFQDLFLNIPLHTQQQGLIDMGAKAKISEGAYSAELALHAFAPAENNSDQDAFYGIEPDLTFGYKLNKNLMAGGGFSYFFPMGGALGRGDTPTPWGFLQMWGSF